MCLFYLYFNKFSVLCSQSITTTIKVRFSVPNSTTIIRVVFLRNVIKHVEIKCQLDATEVFIADLIAC